MRIPFLLIAAILLQGTGNLCLSQRMKDLASTAHPIALAAIASPPNVTGLLLLVGFFAIFTTVLARADLSVVVPIVSFEIVVNVALAHWIIHDLLPLCCSTASTRNMLMATFRNVLKTARDDGVIDAVPHTRSFLAKLASL